MGFFKNILEKLGIGEEDKEEEVKTTPKKTTAQPRRSARTSGAPVRKASSGKSDPVKPLYRKTTMELVDVESKLDGLAKAFPIKLNWKVSIVDLLTLLDIDCKYEDLKALAIELKCPEELMSDSAKMNTWLHKNVLRLISENGGRVPKALLD